MNQEYASFLIRISESNNETRPSVRISYRIRQKAPFSKELMDRLALDTFLGQLCKLASFAFVFAFCCIFVGHAYRVVLALVCVVFLRVHSRASIPDRRASAWAQASGRCVATQP